MKITPTDLSNITLVISTVISTVIIIYVWFKEQLFSSFKKNLLSEVIQELESRIPKQVSAEDLKSEVMKELQPTILKLFSDKDLKKLSEIIKRERYESNRINNLQKILGNIDIQSFRGNLFATNIPQKLVEPLKSVGFKRIYRKNPKNGISQEMYMISGEYFNKNSLISFLSALVKSSKIEN